MDELSNVNLNTILLTEGPVYNGDMWTKVDLIQYIDKAIKLQVQFEARMETLHEHYDRQEFIRSQKKRRTISFPVVEKPTGLASLSRSKNKRYEKWLSEAPQREQELKSFEEKENNRIGELVKEEEALDLLVANERNYLFKLTEEFKNHMLRQIIPPDYRNNDILRLLLSYLMDNRAHTLTDAINLYHQEKHWKSLENIAAQQKNEIRRAREEQEALMREQIWQQAEHMREMQSAANATKRAAEGAEFWLMMNYFKD